MICDKYQDRKPRSAEKETNKEIGKRRINGLSSNSPFRSQSKFTSSEKPSLSQTRPGPQLLFPQHPVLFLPCTCISSVQSLSRVRLSATPWIAARQASLSITNSWSFLKLMSIESVMPSHHLILRRPFLLPPSIFPSIRVFSSESVFCIRWP